MSSTSAAWNDLNNAVLEVFKDLPLETSDVQRALPGVPDSYIRAALHQNTERGLLAARPGAVHTTYRLTEAGRAHLASVMEVA